MQDLKARLEKLISDAAECDIIANLATDERKRQSFARLAKQYKGMADAIRLEIATREQDN